MLENIHFKGNVFEHSNFLFFFLYMYIKNVNFRSNFHVNMNMCKKLFFLKPMGSKHYFTALQLK